MTRARLIGLASVVAFGAVLVALDWPATLTDEDDYMPFALGDVLAGRNPYATSHSGGGVIERPWGEQEYSWETTYPYLPALLFLQVPGLDYRWTALAAYALLLVALRHSTWGFWAFANPLVAWFAASGFNDFVALALLAWASRTPSGWPAWVAAACKQFVLPMLVADAVIRRSWRVLAPVLACAVISLPFVLWDPSAFARSAILQHASKAPIAYDFWNYWLYPLFFASVMLPAAWSARNGATSGRDARAASRKA